MTTQIIVIENRADWKYDIPDCEVINVKDYIGKEEFFKAKNVQVVNLCRGYRYLSIGYYCSLLAEARRHRVIPSVKTVLDLSSKAMYSLDTENLDDLIQKSLKKSHGEKSGASFEISVFFGHCRFEGLSDLARQIFETFPCPLLRVEFERSDKWHINAIKPVSVKKLRADESEDFVEALQKFVRKRWRGPRSRNVLPYDMAILYNPQDPLPPSDRRASAMRVGYAKPKNGTVGPSAR